MISSLDDAWKWYEGVRTLARDMSRLGEKFWNRSEWAEPLGLDNRFRSVTSDNLRDRASTILKDLDDLAVLLMFSVFEAIVRYRAEIDIGHSLPKQLHPAVAEAVVELIEDIQNGSFGKVTRRFRKIDLDLVEEVNQVRIYRNWVAHGRRTERPASVTPEKAYDRLTRFLDRMAEVAIPPAAGADAS
jgi:hypothetical protein